MAATVPVCISDDVEAAAAAVSGYAALYIGGMGSREKNFYNQLACRMGFEDAARQVQDLYLARQHRDAAAAVLLEFIDATSLIGPRTDPRPAAALCRRRCRHALGRAVRGHPRGPPACRAQRAHGGDWPVPSGPDPQQANLQ